MSALKTNASLANMEGNILDVSDYNWFISQVNKVLTNRTFDNEEDAHYQLHIVASRVMRNMFVNEMDRMLKELKSSKHHKLIKKIKTYRKNFFDDDEDLQDFISVFQIPFMYHETEKVEIDLSDGLNQTERRGFEFFKTVFGLTDDWEDFRHDFLEPVTATTQCANIIQERCKGILHTKRLHDGKKYRKCPNDLNQEEAKQWYIDNITCYICSNSLNDRRLKHTPECEHLLPIFVALKYLWIVDNKWEERNNPQKQIINLEYEYAHKCCNSVKNDFSFIRWREGDCEIDDDNIEHVYEKIKQSRGETCPNIVTMWEENGYIKKKNGRRKNFNLIKRKLKKRLMPIVEHINSVCNDFQRNIVGKVNTEYNYFFYTAWTKLRALNMLTNEELWELLLDGTASKKDLEVLKIHDKKNEESDSESSSEDEETTGKAKAWDSESDESYSESYSEEEIKRIITELLKSSNKSYKANAKRQRTRYDGGGDKENINEINRKINEIKEKYGSVLSSNNIKIEYDESDIIFYTFLTLGGNINITNEKYEPAVFSFNSNGVTIKINKVNLNTKKKNTLIFPDDDIKYPSENLKNFKMIIYNQFNNNKKIQVNENMKIKLPIKNTQLPKIPVMVRGGNKKRKSEKKKKIKKKKKTKRKQKIKKKRKTKKKTKK